MLARRLLHLRFPSKLPSFTNNPFSSSRSIHHFPSPSLPSPNPQSLATNTFSLLNNRKSFSSNGEDTWKFTAEPEKQDSIFKLEEETRDSWDEGSSVDVEIMEKEGGGDVVWETTEGYKPWSIGGEDDEKRDLFDVGEDVGVMEGFEGEGVDELEKERDEEQEKLQQREQELLATLNGNRIAH